jgi:non-canonical (house-cleaning) NTP pyrophosphatase
MTRSDDQLPGNLSVIHDALKARVAIAEQAKADLFVAIHVSASGPGKGFDSKYSGFEVFVSQHESSNLQQSKQFGSAVLQELNKIYTTNTTLRQRTDKGIWVLDKTPCPALLIECGYMTNETDLNFIKQSSNQEIVAKKILEGIVNSRNKTVAAVEPAIETEKLVKVRPVETATPVTITRTSAPATATNDPAFEENMMKALERAAERNRNKRVLYQRPAIFYQEVPKQASKEISFDPTDPVTQNLSRHFCRATRYPNQVLTNNGEGVVYFSLSVDANGNIKNLRLYDQAPAEASLIKNITVVGYSSDSTVAATPISKEEINKALQGEIKRAWEKKPDLSGLTPHSTPYFFKVQFQVLAKQTVTT